MVREKYQKDCERCRWVGEMVGDRWSGESKYVITLFYSYSTELAISTCREHVANYMNGGPLAQKCSSGERPSRVDTGKHVDRFSLFCGILGIKEDDEIIKVMKEVNPLFRYSLSETNHNP